MKEVNKLYLVTVSEYKGDMSNKENFYYCSKRFPEYTCIQDSLEDALDIGKRSIRSLITKMLYTGIDDYEDYRPNKEILKEQVDSFINFRLKELRINYCITIDIISGNRKIFSDVRELLDYFNTNISNITNDELYDFLLSIACSDQQLYDYNGKFIENGITMPIRYESEKYKFDIKFTEQSCRNGIYKFECISY